MAKKRETATDKSNTIQAPSPAVGDAAATGVGVQPAQFPIVGIGASAGGLEALEELLDQMPAETGMAFVVVTHQHPGHTSLLPELLGRSTALKVLEARDGLKVEPNHVYVGPPGGYLAIFNGTLHRMETEGGSAPRLPIDSFFRSLAEDQKEKAICIILSGTGTDGTLGMRAIKGESGMAMIEEPQSAKYSGMPASAIATGLADYILPPSEMPRHLVAYAKGPYLCDADTAAEEKSLPTEPMQKILVLLRARTGNDFSSYKMNTLRRRIERRINVHQIENSNQYVRYLQENPHELDLLFKELLIGVTTFFRDPEAWDALLQGPLLDLLQLRPDGYTFRAWVPGCSSGEEVFSLAIALRECIEQIKRHFEIQIFGTDLDVEAIEVARASQFPDGIAVDVSPARLERYFVPHDNAYRVRKDIREMAVFATQNVIKDPPFTKLDFISCRNLLIYLNGDLQRRLLPIFHYALKPGGLLFLGPSETVGAFSDLFETVDKRWKIFRRKESPTVALPAQLTPREPGERTRLIVTPPLKETHVFTLIERLLLQRFAPVSVVVNDRGDIIYLHGRTGTYLEPTEGEPRNNVLEMAREGLQLDLAAAMRHAATQDEVVVRENVRVKTNGDYTIVNVTVAKITDPEMIRGLLLVTFSPPKPTTLPEKPAAKSRRKKSAADGHIADLEGELRFTKDSLQSTVEQLETSNEELKSTNEELQSTNEELQSTNEELETSKEEMQSLNEELTTVNAELQTKVEDLSQANDDMQNLLNSTDIATVFLDNDLNIKRFTEKSKVLITLRPSDVGRPISELASNLQFDDLAGHCRTVLKTLVFQENEVRTKDGSNYLMRILPYRTADNAIDGLVITFVDINRVKEAERIGAESTAYFRNIIDTMWEPLVVLDQKLKVVSANRAFYALFQTTLKRTEGESLFLLGGGEWNIPEMRQLLENILPEKQTVEKFEVRKEFPQIGPRVFQINARRLERDRELPAMILLAIHDATTRVK